MSYYLKTLLSEQEKKRILSLHQDRRKSEFRGLIKEAIDPNVQKFFEGLKTTLPGFPKDGYIYETDIDGKPTTVWEVLDTANNLKYYLLQDGTAVDSKGQKSTNKWYTSLPTAPTTVLGSGPTVPTGEQPAGTEAQGGTVTPSATGSGPQGMMTGREANQSRRALKRELKAAKRQLKKENKKNVQNCLTYFKNWERDWNQKDEALQVIVKETSPNYKSYVNFLSSCCNILNENGKQPTLVGLCSTKGVEPETILGSGPTTPAANNPVSGAPAPGTEVTGAIPPSSSIANTPVGAGMPTQGTTGTQGAPNAGPQNMPGMSGKSGSGMGRLSAEDQELRDLGLQ